MRHWVLASLVCFFPLASAPAQDPPAQQRTAQTAEQKSQQQADEEIRRSLEKITRVYHEVVTQLADTIDAEQALYAGAIRGALARLDPFSVFLDSGQWLSFQQQQRGVQQGFGAILSLQAGQVTVLQATPNAPFARAGLGPGDRIIRINGHRVPSMDLRELVEVLQAARSGRVRLSVIRSSRVVPEDFDLDPSEIPTSTVDKKFWIEPGVGYMHVAHIEQATPGEMQDILEEWAPQDLRALLLDFRGNPGGSLEAAVDIAGLFLPRDSVITSVYGRSMPKREYRVEGEPIAPSLPVVVILDRRTASAAEIISAALQEHDRAWLVGEPSFGKGVVETVMPLGDSTALVLTVARYLTPSGRSVQRPLPGTALAGILSGTEKAFTTGRGRLLTELGGVAPDQKAESWQLDSWARFLEESTAFINFAQRYLERRGRIGDDFAVGDPLIDDFRRYLEESGVVIPASWERLVPFFKARIQTELFNLVFGITRGNEIEVKADPQVQAALQAVGRARELLAADAVAGLLERPELQQVSGAQ
jgi:carboxyl-terminal processing protease